MQSEILPLPPPASPCVVSVIISTRNRAESIDETVSHLARQQLSDGEFEVIVADNGSTDGTTDVLNKWSNSGLRLQSFVEPTPGKNRALNRALQIANGSLLVFTDDDVIPEAKWLQSIVDVAKRWPEDSIFGGPVIPKFPDGTPPFVQEPEFRWGAAAFARLDPGFPEGPMAINPYGPNLTIRRSVFDRFRYSENIGPAGNSYAMGSEAELLGRLSRAGYRFIFAPEARVQHVIRPEQVTLSWLAGRAYRAGRGAAALFQGPRQHELFGVPRWIWRKYLVALAADLASRVASQKKRWCVAMELQRYRGMIFEFRSQSCQGAVPVARARIPESVKSTS